MPCLFLVSCIKGRRIVLKKKCEAWPYFCKPLPSNPSQVKEILAIFLYFPLTHDNPIWRQCLEKTWCYLKNLNCSYYVFNIQYFNIKSIPDKAVRLMWAVWACCSGSGFVENGNRPLFSYSRHYSVILVIIQLFSSVFSYSRQYSVILASIQLFSPLCFCTVLFSYSRHYVLSKVQCIYYHALAFQAKSIFAIYWNIS